MYDESLLFNLSSILTCAPLTFDRWMNTTSNNYYYVHDNLTNKIMLDKSTAFFVCATSEYSLHTYAVLLWLCHASYRQEYVHKVGMCGHVTARVHQRQADCGEGGNAISES